MSCAGRGRISPPAWLGRAAEHVEQLRLQAPPSGAQPPPAGEPEKIIKMFETYAEEEDCLGMEGLCSLCEAVGIDPETDVRLLCFCWRNNN